MRYWRTFTIKNYIRLLCLFAFFSLVPGLFAHGMLHAFDEHPSNSCTSDGSVKSAYDELTVLGQIKLTVHTSAECIFITLTPGKPLYFNQDCTYDDSESASGKYRARYFDTNLGRFISRDPLGYVDGMGLYNGYFAEMFGMDPSGLDVSKTYIQEEMDISNNKKQDAPIAEITVKMSLTDDCKIICLNPDEEDEDEKKYKCTGNISPKISFEWKALTNDPLHAVAATVGRLKYGNKVVAWKWASGKTPAANATKGEAAAGTIDVDKVACNSKGGKGTVEVHGYMNGASINKYYDIKYSFKVTGCGTVTDEKIELLPSAFMKTQYINGGRGILRAK